MEEDGCGGLVGEPVEEGDVVLKLKALRVEPPEALVSES
jgi:hypothetical protein